MLRPDPYYFLSNLFQIRKRYSFSTLDDKATWGEIQEKMIARMNKLEEAFRKYISELDI